MKTLLSILSVIWLFFGHSFLASAAGCNTVKDTVLIRANHLNQLNAIRARQSLGRLVANTKLDRIAQEYACLLAATGRFDHVGPDGSTLTQRVDRGDYTYCLVAENLATGQQSVNEAMIGWVKSPGHWRNIRLKQVEEVGFGVAYPDSGKPVVSEVSKNGKLTELANSLSGKPAVVRMSRQQYYWVQLLARPC